MIIVQRNKIIEILDDIEAIEFIRLHRDDAPETLAMKYAKKVSFDLTTATQLLQLYHKAKTKIPLWSEKLCALTSRSYEQASSQRVATYKASLFKGGNHLVDLTAGLGVDSACFSHSFQKITSVEQNNELFILSNFNLARLGIKNIQCIHSTAEDFVPMVSQFVDMFYLDPDRRSASGKKQILLEEHQPNVLDLKEKLFNHSNRILIKLSPMADITYLKRVLPEACDMWVISEHNEVKEVLVLMQKGVGQEDEVIIHAVDLANGIKEYHTSQPVINAELCGNQPYRYLFEPAKAIIKAGLSRAYAGENGVSSISEFSHYYLSDHYQSDAMGRWFEIEEEFPVQWKQIKTSLKKRGITQIQIAKRSFPESTEVIRSRLKITDGGDRMLLFTTDSKVRKRCFLVKRMITAKD